MLAMQLEYPKPDGWVTILCNLADAVRALNQDDIPDPPPFRYDWTPQERAQREKLVTKALTLDDLKQQVDNAFETGKSHITTCHWPGHWPGVPDEISWLIGDFEVRRRKK